MNAQTQKWQLTNRLQSIDGYIAEILFFGQKAGDLFNEIDGERGIDWEGDNTNGPNGTHYVSEEFERDALAANLDMMDFAEQLTVV